jgi:hypothetical protein
MLSIRNLLLLLLLPTFLSCSSFHPSGDLDISQIKKISIYYYPEMESKFSLSMNSLRSGNYGTLTKQIKDIGLIKQLLTFPKIKKVKSKNVIQDFRLVMDCYNDMDDLVQTIAVTINNKLLINNIGYQSRGKYSYPFAATRRKLVWQDDEIK